RLPRQAPKEQSSWGLLRERYRARRLSLSHRLPRIVAGVALTNAEAQSGLLTLGEADEAAVSGAAAAVDIDAPWIVLRLRRRTDRDCGADYGEREKSNLHRRRLLLVSRS